MFLSNQYYIIFLMVLITFLSDNNLVAQENKPDLIIESVTSKVVYPKRNHEPGQPVRRDSPSSRIEYVLTIKNIGTAAFSNSFYISWTNSDNDIFTGHYSSSSIVNMDKKLIDIGRSINIRITSPMVSIRNRKFLINTDGKPHLRTVLPVIEELSYKNNTYMYYHDN